MSIKTETTQRRFIPFLEAMTLKLQTYESSTAEVTLFI